ncbi:hypothetical protein COS54_03180 [Candidatus Shapirobacteria bacterium CG03_land_8_20_14_0_80_39_12]|uniref:Uncharacterized protein n=1 Tax=Candidatus Shapirobacteria bacterium CG03_land_8_20_14_0_80_39_12 TaxID=1974879 RepID=A0A2M7BB90_9BACT|nr:MAG: hypothetical protein COS54_03180 [Candidatus Shapirobacteria bacterium CG03_land_8_20_14_0_80_39_12]
MKILFENIKKHLVHYLVLLFLLVSGGLSFFYFQRFSQAQIVSAFLTASFYVLWGVIHHYLEGDLHLRVVVEYMAVAILGFLVLFTLVNRV